MATPNTYVSLFSSGGLGCYGFKLENFVCLATAELLPRRMEVQRANNVCEDPSGYIVGDLTDDAIRSKVISQVANYRFSDKSHELTLLVATPPCQGMSVANHKKSTNEIVRNSLVVESLRILRELKPKYFVLENVRSFLNAQCVDRDEKAKTVREALKSNLGAIYNYEAKVLNLKDFGSPSSRTRTLIIGVRKDITDVTPNDFFPDEEKAVSMGELIGEMPRLTKMGEFSDSDHLHQFRSYQPHMRSWIQGLKPGQSAFDNPNPINRPHRVLNGVIVENQRKNGDKYKRTNWENVPPCVHTRNDILSSQATVHPEDDRVFSIRELMRFMGVPEEFKWSTEDNPDLTSADNELKVTFLKKHEINIRQCLGEGVPTPIFRKIGKKIADFTRRKYSSTGDSIAKFETGNIRRKEMSAYYTRQDIAFSLAAQLPSFQKSRISILEPSVGAGALLPSIISKYEDKTIDLTIIDLDDDALKLARKIASSVRHPALTIKVVRADFLTYSTTSKFDLVVGNPPYGKSTLATGGRSGKGRSGNLFSLFFKKALECSDYVSLIIPKSFLSSPEHASLRKTAQLNHIRCISDFGTRAFSDVKIETIAIHTGPMVMNPQTIIDSLVLPVHRSMDQSYIADLALPTWIIYRDEFFDRILGSIGVGAFDVYRDRSLSRKHMSDDTHYGSSVPVLQARNIGIGEIVSSGECRYIREDQISDGWKKLRDRNDLVAVPNLSYYPRAAPVPDGFVPDGSAAILIPVSPGTIDVEALEWFSTELFFYYYRVSRNYSVRSLNVDSCSVYYFGLPLESDKLPSIQFSRDSSAIYKMPTMSMLTSSS